jgi:hypothetical protein
MFAAGVEKIPFPDTCQVHGEEAVEALVARHPREIGGQENETREGHRKQERPPFTAEGRPWGFLGYGRGTVVFIYPPTHGKQYSDQADGFLRQQAYGRQNQKDIGNEE